MQGPEQSYKVTQYTCNWSGTIPEACETPDLARRLTERVQRLLEQEIDRECLVLIERANRRQKRFEEELLRYEPCKVLEDDSYRMLNYYWPGRQCQF